MIRSKFSSFLCALVGATSILLAAGYNIHSTAQDSLSDPVVTQSVVMGEPSAKSLGDFRKAVISAAEAQCKAKEITRVQLIMLRIATMNKATLERMHQACAEQVLADGAAQSYGAIDWTKLAAFIKEMIPIILELIKLFAENGYVWQTQHICYQNHSFPLAIGYQWHSELHLAA